MSALTTLITTALMVIGAVSVVKRLQRGLSHEKKARQDPQDLPSGKAGGKAGSGKPDIVEMQKNPETGAYEAKK